MSIVATAFLALIKYSVGALSGSIALVADAIHSLTDVISSIGAAFFGLKISSRMPSDGFPYGFYKAENIASLFLALAIFYAGYEIILSSVEKFEEVILTDVYASAIVLAGILGIHLKPHHRIAQPKIENYLRMYFTKNAHILAIFYYTPSSTL